MIAVASQERVPVRLDNAWVGNLERAGLELNTVDRLLSRDARRARPIGDGAPSQADRNWTSWADDRMGVFAANLAEPSDVLFDLRAATDLFAIRIGGPADRSYMLGDRVARTEAAEAVLVFLPRGTKFGILSGGMKSVTLVSDADRLPHSIGVARDELPRTLRDALDVGKAAVEKIHASAAAWRVAAEIADFTASARCANLYLEGKCRQLMWAVLEHLYRLEEGSGTEPELTASELRNLFRVREAIERAPCASNPIEDYAALAAMNRTKLRAAFKKVYGETISEYRTSVRMKRADRLLRESALTIAEIGDELGYADTSSFFAAFKRFFGQPPGRYRGN